jgi:putative redox protein
MADSTALLRWDGGQRFAAGTLDGPQIVIDGTGAAGPSPMTALLLSLGGCMAADVVDIARKMRLSIETLELHVEGDRAAEPPRRYLRVRLRFRVRGVPPADEPKLRRAIDLSFETYCSVFHTLRPDLDVAAELELG